MTASPDRAGLLDEAQEAFASDGIAAAEKVWPEGVALVAKLALAATEDSEGPGLDVERLAAAFAAAFPRGAADPHETARLVAAADARLREDSHDR